MPVTRRWLSVAALTIGALTLAAMASQLIGARGLMLANGQPIFGDYLAFWSAGRLVLEGRGAEIYAASAILDTHRAAVPGIDVLFPFRHPPTFLFIAAPLAALPFAPSALAFIALSGALFLFAAHALTRRAGDLVFAATAPAALLQIGSVQMGLLISGLTGLAFAWLAKRPLAAGACIGLLAIKPHLALLWPVLLIVQRRWRVFLSAAATAILFTLLSGLVFGWDLFPSFIAAASDGQQSLRGALIEKGATASLYANLSGLGAPAFLAAMLHGASALAALVLAFAIFRRNEAHTSAAALASATLLLSPYLFFYDTTLLLIAVAALAPGARGREIGVFCFAWASAGLSLALGLVATLPLLPLASWAMLLIAARRAGVMSQGNPAARPA